MRELAGFPKRLPVADVWLGPEGQIGLTWEFDNDKSIDLLFTSENWTIRFTDDLEQHHVPLQELSQLLADLAA